MYANLSKNNFICAADSWVYMCIRVLCYCSRSSILLCHKAVSYAWWFCLLINNALTIFIQIRFIRSYEFVAREKLTVYKARSQLIYYILTDKLRYLQTLESFVIEEKIKLFVLLLHIRRWMKLAGVFPLLR